MRKRKQWKRWQIETVCWRRWKEAIWRGCEKNKGRERKGVGKCISLTVIYYADGNFLTWNLESLVRSNKRGARPPPLHLPLSLLLIPLSSLLHRLPGAHLRWMILPSDCGNYPRPAAEMHYAQQTSWWGGGGEARLLFSGLLMHAGRSSSRTGGGGLVPGASPLGDDRCVKEGGVDDRGRRLVVPSMKTKEERSSWLSRWRRSARSDLQKTIVTLKNKGIFEEWCEEMWQPAWRQTGRLWAVCQFRSIKSSEWRCLFWYYFLLPRK